MKYKKIQTVRDWFQELAHETHFLKMGILAQYKQEELEKMCVKIRGKCLEHEEELYRLGDDVAITSYTNTKREEDLESALRHCIDALYEAIDIAPLDKLPRKAGDAIQEAQHLLGM